MKCIICDKDNWKEKFSKLLVCKHCGFVRAKDKYFKIPSRKLYSPAYFKGEEYLDYELEQRAVEKNFIDRLKKIRKFIKKGKLLEIGSAMGFFLRLANKYYDTQGIDLDPKIVKNARKVSHSKIFIGDFLKAKLSKNKYDVICMFDTIEHLKKPDEYIKKVFKLLKPSGIVVIETGDIGSLLPTLQGASWRLITPPYHLQYFKRLTLLKLLQKNKFKIEYVTNNISFYRTLKQTFYRLNLPNFTKVLTRPVENLVFPTYTFDLVFVIARKNK